MRPRDPRYANPFVRPFATAAGLRWGRRRVCTRAASNSIQSGWNVRFFTANPSRAESKEIDADYAAVVIEDVAAAQLSGPLQRQIGHRLDGAHLSDKRVEFVLGVDLAIGLAHLDRAVAVNK